MPTFNYIIEGSNKYADRQNKEMQKQTPSKPGKHTINSFGELKRLPGVEIVKRKKK